MAYTYSKLGSYTVGSSGISNIDFVNIPQNYTDLSLIITARDNRPTVLDSEFYIRFNSNTTGYSHRVLYGAGTGTANSFSGSTYPPSLINSAGSTANSFSNSVIYIPNYTDSNYKSFTIDSVDEGNVNSGQYIYMVAGIWSNTSAINQITLTPYGGYSFVQYSTAYLYGIKAEV